MRRWISLFTICSRFFRMELKGLALFKHQGFCSDGAICLHSPLESELSDGFVWYANLIFGKAKEQGSSPLTRHKTKRGQPQGLSLFCWWSIKDSNLGPTGYTPREDALGVGATHPASPRDALTEQSARGSLVQAQIRSRLIM